MSYKDEIIEEYYQMTFHDLMNDIPVSDVVETLKDFEKAELYLECAGIHRALKTWLFIELYSNLEEFKTNKIYFTDEEV